MLKVLLYVSSVSLPFAHGGKPTFDPHLGLWNSQPTRSCVDFKNADKDELRYRVSKSQLEGNEK